ncbi:MAG: hypothetical protein IJX21_07885 [Alistipes sp.]|nr:hypothetical protein [Alistipes sp.]
MSKKQIYIEPSISLFVIYIERGFAQSDGLGMGIEGWNPEDYGGSAE